MRKISPIRKFENTDSSVIARFEHGLGNFRVGIVKNRNKSCRKCGGNHLRLIESSHNQTYYLDTLPETLPFINDSTSCTVTRL